MTKDSPYFVSIALCGFLGRMGSSIIEVSKSLKSTLTPRLIFGENTIGIDLESSFIWSN